MFSTTSNRDRSPSFDARKGAGRQFHGERRGHAFVAFNGIANSDQEICAYEAPSSARYKSTQEILSKMAA